MKFIFSEFGDVALSAICGVLIIGLFISVIFTQVLPIGAEAIETNINETPLQNNRIVTIENFVVKDAVLNVGENFDYKDRIIATNSRGEDIREYVTIENLPDTTTPGEKEIMYVLRYNGEKALGKAKLFVEG